MKNNESMVYTKKKEESIEKIANKIGRITEDAVAKMLNLGKATLRGGESVINRPPVYRLGESLDRSADLGRVVSRIEDLTEQANRAKSSLRNTYFGGKNSPSSLLAKARDTAYKDLPKGIGFTHEGSNLKDLANREIEESVFRSLARQSHIPEVDQYTRNLIATKDKANSELTHLLKSVKDDFSQGKEPTISVYNPNGPNIALQVDRPVASYNGSPVINTKKTLNIDGIESFNEKHKKLEKELQRQQHLSGPNFNPLQVQKAKEELERSSEFKNAFEDKLKLMSASANKPVNKAQFTLDDLDSVHKVKSFLKNPHLEQKHKLLDDVSHENLTNWIIHNVENGGPNVKKSLTDSLDAIAQDPNTVNYLQGFQFQRYSPEEMKNVMEAVKGTKSNLNEERFRGISDALGIAGIGGATGLLGYAGYKSANPDKYDNTKLLHHGNLKI